MNRVSNAVKAVRGMAGALGRSGAESHFEIVAQKLAKDALTAVAFRSSDHGLGEDYAFRVEVIARIGLNLEQLLGSEATLSMRWAGDKVHVHGVISHVEDLGDSPEGALHELVISSPLWPLKQYRHNRVFLNRTVEQIVTEVLEAAEIPAASFEFDLGGDYPQREFVVQYEESDFEFVSRLLAHDGIFYAVEQDARRAKVLFCDDAARLAGRLGKVKLPYVPQSGQSRTSETVFSLARRVELRTSGVSLKDYNDYAPELPLQVETQTASPVPAVGVDSRYGEHYPDDAEGRRLAQVRQEALDWQRDVLVMESDCRGLAPGKCLQLSGHPDPGLNGDWVVLSVEHAGDERAAYMVAGDPERMVYRNKMRLIRAGVAYRSPLPAARRQVYGVFTALIESDGGEYAYVDADGRYRIRLPFDLSAAEPAEASAPVRLMQPYGGADHGMHFPLHAGTEVAVSCVNGDLNRPFILGVLHNADTPSPVTGANPSQNILRTFGGNELVMEDRAGEERIELFTRDRENILTLDAREGAHQVRLATEEGDMELYAGKSMLIECGESQTTQVGADHEVTVEGAQRLMTKTGEIAYQAATDLLLRAEENVRINAEHGELELTAEADMIIQSGADLSLEVLSDNATVLVDQGDFQLEAAGAITFKGQGNGAIHIGQSGGAIEISAGGDLIIDAPSVEITGDKIAIQGQGVGNN